MFYFSQQIKSRLADTYLIELRIASHPHLEPDKQKEFVDQLLAARPDFVRKQDRLDRDGLELLKHRLAKESKFVKVK